MEGVNGSFDGGLAGVGLNLHHSLDDGLDEELVLGVHTLGGFSNLLGERNEGVLDLNEGVLTKVSIGVVSLSFLEFFNSLTNNIISIAVFRSSPLVGFFSISESLLSILEGLVVSSKGVLGIL